MRNTQRQWCVVGISFFAFATGRNRQEDKEVLCTPGLRETMALADAGGQTTIVKKSSIQVICLEFHKINYGHAAHQNRDDTPLPW